ncbi:hypothetical protein RI844_14410 [Thalassotalea fonticola]|uniref:DUF4864 domain-containing protein n=1 Tax=Thalassotalea fonticola TaxID=3065649 RepID=A0ABZ0GLF5_9GAMM|nr:hypothetical protein RI844_14410 [Colwelliaceae bacterium S1-1]
MLKVTMLFIVIFSSALHADEIENKHLDGAFGRILKIENDENNFTEKFSSTYIIMHKKLYGPNAYLSQFRCLDGVANESKAALLVSAINSTDNTRWTYLIKMAYEESQWQVISIGTYDKINFEKNKNSYLQ